MKIEVDKIVTLASGDEYLIIDKVVSDDKEYFYIAEVNDEKNDIKDNYKIITISYENDRAYFNEVLGETNLKKVLPLFIKDK